MSRYSSTACRVGLAALAAGALAACGDARAKDLTAGISRDSTLAIMQTVPSAADSLPNVHERGVYLIGGKLMEVMLFPRDGSAHKGETIPDEEITPVVLANDSLMGWGWTFWDSVATANRLPRRPQ
ncbi:MAG TPA: hypothetical protein VFG84_10340 [Gemmatimonadaceae bacterium]|nr:hypothetical protein [Gemmatimonadaceae bacterium]